MTNERIIELLEIEKECVLRNACGECNRACHICDLLQNDTELHEMYAEVIARMKAQTSCEDAVSREAVNDAIARSAHWADMKGRIAALPSVKPVPMARVMTLEEWREWKRKPLSQRDLVYYVDNKGVGSWIAPNDQLFIYATPELGYGTLFVCWTSRPTDTQMEVTGWNERSVQ